MTEAVFRRF